MGLGQVFVQGSSVLPHQTQKIISSWTRLCAWGPRHVETVKNPLVLPSLCRSPLLETEGPWKTDQKYTEMCGQGCRWLISYIKACWIYTSLTYLWSGERPIPMICPWISMTWSRESKNSSELRSSPSTGPVVVIWSGLIRLIPGKGQRPLLYLHSLCFSFDATAWKQSYLSDEGSM